MSLNFLDLNFSQILNFKFDEKESKELSDLQPIYSIDDFIKLLQQFENNKHIKARKNLMTSKNKATISLINDLIKFSQYILITDDCKINFQAIELLKKAGYLIFPLRKNKDDTWLDICICTKKGQIRF